MVHISKRLIRYGTRLIAFTLTGILSGIAMDYVSPFLPGFLFGIVLSCYFAKIKQHVCINSLFAPLVCGIIFLIAIFSPGIFISLNFRIIDNFLAVYSVSTSNLQYLEAGFIGSIFLALYAIYLGSRKKYVLPLILYGTGISFSFFGYHNVTDGSIFNKSYPFILWQVGMGNLLLYALFDSQNIWNE